MAWETKTFKYVCDGCNEDATYEGRKCPTWCEDCRDFRKDAYQLAIARPNYPKKLCKGCGVHMSNFDYGKNQFCTECFEYERRRHNGWTDPYISPIRPLFAANDNEPASKTCSQCECDLPLRLFIKHKSGGAGVSAQCRDCQSIIRKLTDRNGEYERRREARGRSNNKTKRLRLIERWNRKRLKEVRALRRQMDKYLNVFYKPWNKPGLTEGEKYRLRYANDNEFVLRERTRQRIRRKGFGFNALWRMRQSLNGEVGDVGIATIEAALGYSMSDLRIHLEDLFTDGMSWDEFRSGRIHIDHKKPLSRFDLNDPAQAAEAWSLGNLQPLWAKDNMEKGAKTDEEWRAAA